VAGQVTIISIHGERENVTLETDMDTLQYGEIHNDIVALLQCARNASARSVNALMTATYWEIGRRITSNWRMSLLPCSISLAV